MTHLTAARSARGLVLALLAALALVGLGPTAAHAAPGIALSATPAAQTVTRGTAATYTVTVSGTDGFSGRVVLAAVWASSAGLSGGLATSVVTVPRNGSASTTLTLTPSATAPDRTTAISLFATDGRRLALTSVRLTVDPGTFTLTAAPSLAQVAPGGTATFTVTVNPANGFRGTVDLSRSGLPRGWTGRFSPRSVTVSAATPVSSTLTVSVPTTAAAGTTNLTLTGSWGPLVRQTTVGVAVGVPGFSVTAAPTTVTVPAGLRGATTVTVAGTSGWANSVSLGATGLPNGVTAAFTPTLVPISPSTTSGTSTLTFTVAGTVAPQTTAVTVVGTSSGVTRSATVSLVVTAAPTVSLAADPARVVTQPKAGADATYGLTATTTNLPAGQSLSFAVSALPAGTTAEFSANPTTNGRTDLVVKPTASTPTGSFPLTVTATATLPGGAGQVTNSIVLTLVVEPAPIPFTVTGPVAQARSLAPGVTIPVNLRITNPNSVDLAVSDLTVTLASTSDEVGCAAATNYAVTQFQGSYADVVVPAGSAKTLQELGIPESRWPTLSMLNLPVNQDACKGVTLNLSFTGTGSGGVR